MNPQYPYPQPDPYYQHQQQPYYPPPQDHYCQPPPQQPYYPAPQPQVYSQPLRHAQSMDSQHVASSQQPPAAVSDLPAPVAQFQELRHHATVDSALKQLRELATDLSAIDASSFSPEPDLRLGVGPINDAITVAANHRCMSYRVYSLHNPPHKKFLKLLRVFLQRCESYLTVFCTGQVKDASGDEADGYDEAVVFDDGHIVDDGLASA